MKNQAELNCDSTHIPVPLRFHRDRRVYGNKKPLRGIGVLALIGIFILYVAELDIGSDLYSKTLSAVLLILVILPLFLYTVQNNGKSAELPLLPPLGAIYGIYYGLPLLRDDGLVLRFHKMSEEAAHGAIEVALVGWIFILVGYFSTGRIGSRWKLGLTIPLQNSQRVAMVFVAIGVLASLVTAFTTLPGMLAQPFRFLTLLGLLGLGLLMALALRGNVEKRLRYFLFYCVIPFYLVLQIPSGLVSTLIYPAMFFLAIFWSVRKKIPWILLLLLAIAVFLLRPAMTEYRHLTWRASYEDASIIEKGGILLNVIQKNLSKGIAGYGENSTKVMSERTNQLATVAWVVEKTPDVVPYWNGDTYLSLFSTLIPRVLWPDKPTKDLGQRFGHRYGLLDYTDRLTSFNFPLLAEAYCNFGWIGIVIVMSITGSIYKLIENGLRRGVDDLGGVIVSGFLLMSLINIESDFSLVFGGITQSLIVLYIVGRLTRRQNRSTIIQ